jgi:hypothetical protein
MVTAWYPYQAANDVMKAMNNAPKIPDFIKKWQIFATPDAEKGVKVYNLIMVNENVSDEAVITIGKNQTYFSNMIKGYSWKVETCVGVKDSMKLLGK